MSLPLIFAVVFAEDAKIVLDLLADRSGKVGRRLRGSSDVDRNPTEADVKKAARSTNI